MQGIRSVVSTPPLTDDGKEIMGPGVHVAKLMADRSVVSAPAMEIGEPFHIGASMQAIAPVPGIGGGPTGA